MKTKRGIFVSAIFVISILCFYIMNINYDKLSRYPYKNEENNQLIRDYLTDEEIEYIIEWSIAPAMFIAYIQEPDFNIYHASEYRELNKLLWYETPSTIVKMVEKTRDSMNSMTLASYLVHYSYDEVAYWIDHGDAYNSNSVLVTNAGNPNAYVDDNHTISVRKPFNLQDLNNNIPSNKNNIQVDIAMQLPLQEMCKAIDLDIKSDRECAGLLVDEGYVSYDDQKAKYEEAKNTFKDDFDQREFMPGHSEHQLGLAVDLVLEGLPNDSFSKTEQYEWLQANAYRFGLIQTYKAENTQATNKFEQSYHYRYVGYELARYLKDNNLSFSDVATN